MSADISSLGGLRPVEMLDLDSYADSKDFTPLPKKGRYTVQAPPTFPSTVFTRSKAGALVAQVDPVIVGPTNENYTLRFTKPSAKVYKRNGVNVSQLGDYLRACGFRGKISDEQAQADAVESTANTIYQVDLDWKAYNKNTGLSVEGMDRFPSDGNGGHLPWIEDPNDFERDETTGELATDAQGNKIPVRLRANVYVSRFVAQG